MCTVCLSQLQKFRKLLLLLLLLSLLLLLRQEGSLKDFKTKNLQKITAHV